MPEAESDPTIAITEIAFSHGFTTPAHFSRCFVEAYGTTPSDARRAAFSVSP